MKLYVRLLVHSNNKILAKRNADDHPHFPGKLVLLGGEMIDPLAFADRLTVLKSAVNAVGLHLTEQVFDVIIGEACYTHKYVRESDGELLTVLTWVVPVEWFTGALTAVEWVDFVDAHKADWVPSSLDAVIKFQDNFGFERD